MSHTEFDAAAARRLVEEISGHLAKLPGDSPHAELRREVERLKGLLANADSHTPAIEAGLRTVHTVADRTATELQADGVRVGMFLRDIGRMLGLD